MNKMSTKIKKTCLGVWYKWAIPKEKIRVIKGMINNKCLPKNGQYSKDDAALTNIIGPNKNKASMRFCRQTEKQLFKNNKPVDIVKMST